MKQFKIKKHYKTYYGHYRNQFKTNMQSIKDLVDTVLKEIILECKKKKEITIFDEQGIIFWSEKNGYNANIIIDFLNKIFKGEKNGNIQA